MQIAVRFMLLVMLLLSADAGCYNQGSQRLCERTLAFPQEAQNYEKRDILLYLTPTQVQILEANGFVLKREDSDSEQQYSPGNDQEENEEITENQKSSEVLQLEKIFRVINNQIAEDARKIHEDEGRQQLQTETDHEEEKEEEYEPGKQGIEQIREQDQAQEKEEQTENILRIPARFGVLQKYLAPSVLGYQNQLDGKITQNEIQFHTKQQELEDLPDFQHDKYAIDIERLRANLELQNTDEVHEGSSTRLISKGQIDANNLQVVNNNQVSLLAKHNNFAGSAPRTSQKYKPFRMTRPIPVPVIKRSKIELITPVPVVTQNLASIAASNKVYIHMGNSYVERIDPIEINKQLISIRKPEDLRVIRHLWEH